MFEGLGSLLWIFFCIILIIILAYFFTRYVIGRGKFGFLGSAKSDAMKIVAQLSVGKDRQLLLVKVGERYFLLGSTAAKLTRLAEFTKEEAEEWLMEEIKPDKEELPSFKESLQTILKNKIKR